MHYSLKTKMALLITISLWASAFPGIRSGLQGYAPGSLALLRFLIASFCMWLACIELPNRNEIARSDKILLLLIGMLGIGFYHIALNYGEISVPSGTASFIIALSPIVTLVSAMLFLRESVRINMWIGMIMSVMGVGLMMLDKTNQLTFHAGVCYVLAASFIGGIYSVLQKPFLQKYHAIEVTAYIIWGATFLLFIYTPSMLHDAHFASWRASISVIYLGVFPA